MKKVLCIFWILAVGFLAALVGLGKPNTLYETLLYALIIGPLVIFAPVLIWLVVTKVALPVLTLGCLRVEKKGEAISFPWYGVARLESKQFVVEANVALVIGICLIMLVGISIAELLAFIRA